VPIVPALDGFRAYAILGVVALHLFGISGVLEATDGTAIPVVIWGVLGNVIDAFFIITAFVLFLPVVARGGELGSVGTYALGRAARLLPPYWLSIAVMLILISLVPSGPLRQTPAFSPELPGAGDLLIHLTALQMPARLLDNVTIGFGVNGPLWMISVIAGFYVVFPVIARAYFRHPFAGLAVTAAITLAWKEAAIHLGGIFEMLRGGDTSPWVVELIITDQLPGWAFSFGLGMTAAWLYVRLHQRHPGAELARTAAVVAFAALVAYSISAYLYGSEAASINALFAGGVARTDPLLVLANTASRGALMAAIVLGPVWLQRPFANRPVRWLAERSYGLYLIHAVVIYYVASLLLGLPTDGSVGSVVLWSAVVLPVSLAYACLSLRLVERPARRWARRLSQPPASPGRALAGAEAGAPP
jgi:peptidoglycan/LPS O-acetylase OafA/YrhL